MSGADVKTCSKCLEDKPADAFEKKGARCKECASEYARQYYAANREKISKRNSNYQKLNRNKHNARQRRYHAANKNKCNERCRQFYLANSEKIIQYQCQYAFVNRNKINERRRKNYAANHDAARQKLNERTRLYRQKLPDSYVRAQIKRDSNIRKTDIPPELLEAKRLQLKLKRIAREAMK